MAYNPQLSVSMSLSDGSQRYDVELPPYSCVCDNYGKVWSFLAPWNNRVYFYLESNHDENDLLSHLRTLAENSVPVLGAGLGGAYGSKGGMKGTGVGGGIGFVLGLTLRELIKHIPDGRITSGYYLDGGWCFEGPLYIR